MEKNENIIEPLFDRIKEYSKTSIDLIKLKSIDKSSDFLSALIFRIILGILFTFALLFLNIAMALWLGDIMGKNYYGYFIVTSFYIVVGIFLRLFRTQIKLNICNSIITYLTNNLCKKSQP